jgi:two-component system, OmpR family, sensor kinase
MSLRLRLLAAFAYVLLLIIVAFEVPLALNLARRVKAEVKNDAASQAFIVAAGASGRMNRPGLLQGLARRAGADLGARVIVVDAKGVVRADSGRTGLGRSYGGRPEIREALSGRAAQGERHSDTLDQDLLYTAVPVTNEGLTVGAVRVTQSVGDVNSRVWRNVLALAAIGGLALLLGLALAWFLAGTLARPLRNLARTARRVEEGDLEARAEVTGASEQREVAHAFNDMAERLGLVLAAQREFVANASHQLRTPLTGLRLRLESAAGKVDSADVQAELAAAEQEAERLARLLTALLTLAREGDRPRPGRPVSLEDAVERAHERWAVRAEQGEHGLALVSGEDVVVEASDEDVAIMLDNLVENALHYSPPGTAVTLEWGRADGNAYFAVLDEGPGIDVEDEAELFERFARGSAGRRGPGGTGLGLAIVRTLARRWRGDAGIANRAEGGARAEVRLPITESALRRSRQRLDGALAGGG